MGSYFEPFSSIILPPAQNFFLRSFFLRNPTTPAALPSSDDNLIKSAQSPSQKRLTEIANQLTAQSILQLASASNSLNNSSPSANSLNSPLRLLG